MRPTTPRCGGWVEARCFLCSDGLTSDSLRGCVARQGRRTCALVATADPEYKERNYHVLKVVYELTACGLSVDIADLDVQPPESLLNYDVVECVGGNPYAHQREACA